MMRSDTVRVDTGGRRVVDITPEARAFARGAGGDAILHVFVPHATVGLALMETGSGSEGDLEEVLGRVFPRDDRYAHRHGSAGHGGDHVMPAFVSPSLSIPVLGGELALGRWQSLVLVDPNRDNDERTVRFSLLEA